MDWHINAKPWQLAHVAQGGRRGGGRRTRGEGGRRGRGEEGKGEEGRRGGGEEGRRGGVTCHFNTKLVHMQYL